MRRVEATKVIGAPALAVFPIRLLPPSVTLPKAFPRSGVFNPDASMFVAMIVLLIVRKPTELAIPPTPNPPVARLLATVELRSVKFPSLRIPPPTLAVFPLTVVLISVAVPAMVLSNAPPPLFALLEPIAVLLLSVLLMIFSKPELVMPPPSSLAILLRTVTFISVVVPLLLKPAPSLFDTTI